MKGLSYRSVPKVTALPSPSAMLEGVILELSTDKKPYYCDGTAWVDLTATGGGGGAVPFASVWTLRGIPQKWWMSACYGNNTFVAVSNLGSGSDVALSSDGINWLGASTPPKQWVGVDYGDGVFVAVAQDATSTTNVMTSMDGYTWKNRVSPANVVFTNVKYMDGAFVAFTNSTTHYYSTDGGITWTAVTWGGRVYTDGVYANGYFVRVASGVASSSISIGLGNQAAHSAKTPIGATAGWGCIAYGNGVFVALSANGNEYTKSADCITWTAGTLPYSGIWSICFAEGYFVAVLRGSSNVITSVDGVTWVNATAADFQNWESICYGDGILVAVHSSGANQFGSMSSGTKKSVGSVETNPIGAGNVSITDADLTLVANTAPVTPAAGQVKIFGKSLAGRILPCSVGPSGMDSALQPARWRQKVAQWNTPGNTTTAPGIDGFANPSAIGTATARAVATTNLFTRTRRQGYVSPATAAGFCGQFSIAAGTQWTTGDGANLGGFFYSCRFGASDAAAVTGARMFVGMSSSLVTPTNVEPSTLLNSIGVAQLSTDATQLYFVYGGSAAQTAIALGTNFPPMAGVGAANGILYDITIFCPPSSNGVVNYRLERVGTAFFVEGTITPAVAGTQTPLNTTLLGHRIWRTNNATTLAVGIDIINIYIESDY